MILSLTARYSFSASHRLHVLDFPEERNILLYGKCNNPYGHGHDYVLSVTAAGEVSAETGLLLCRADLDRLVTEKVLALFRHRYINIDLPQFARLVPTTENVAAVIASLLEENWRAYISHPHARLSRVHVQETARNGFEILIPVPAEKQKKERSEGVIVHA